MAIAAAWGGSVDSSRVDILQLQAKGPLFADYRTGGQGRTRVENMYSSSFTLFGQDWLLGELMAIVGRAPPSNASKGIESPALGHEKRDIFCYLPHPHPHLDSTERCFNASAPRTSATEHTI